MTFDTEQFVKRLNRDNEVTANNIMDVVRQNLEMYDVGTDKQKFLAEKKKQILEVLKEYEEEALQAFQRQVFKIHSRHIRDQSESQIAEENRSFVHKIQKSFDRSDSHNAIRSKNLGISEA